MRIAYVGHPAHEWSKSDSFFLKKLGEMHAVDVFRPQKHEFPEIFPLLISDFYDLLVFWQHDFLAYSISSLGRPCLVVPMLDGSGAKTFKHWSLLARCHFLSFSRELSQYLTLRGLTSTSVQFFPDTTIKHLPFGSKKNQGYAWIRNRDAAFNLPEVSKAASILGLETVMVRVDDDVIFRGAGNLGLVSPFNVRTREEHLELVDQSRFFFAPRRIEGIGMSFLEAMSRGTIVIARKRPTASNYIKHRHSGYLLPPSRKIRDSQLRSDISLPSMSANGKLAVTNHYFSDDLEIAISKAIHETLSKKRSKARSIKSINSLLYTSINGFDNRGPGLNFLPKLSWLTKS